MSDEKEQVKKIKLTEKETENLYNNNGLNLEFISYYKYTFDYRGENDKIIIFVKYGSDVSDIYKHEVNCQPFEAPETFYELIKSYCYISITEKETEKKFIKDRR